MSIKYPFAMCGRIERCWLFTFRELTRGVAWVIEIPYDFARSVLIEGFEKGQGSNAVEIAPSLADDIVSRS